MKYGWVVLLVFAAVTAPLAARAQASAYGEFTASKLVGGPKGDYLYGGSVGVLIDGPHLFHKILLSADVQGRFVSHSGESLNGLAIGPRFAVQTHFLKLAPFAEFMVGFARYNDGSNNSTTDNTFQVNGGVTRPLSSRLDALVDYSYAQYGVNNGEFNPKSFSGGIVYHFVKR
jgi:hypothetical protein